MTGHLDAIFWKVIPQQDSEGVAGIWSEDTPLGHLQNVQAFSCHASHWRRMSNPRALLLHCARGRPKFMLRAVNLRWSVVLRKATSCGRTWKWWSKGSAGANLLVSKVSDSSSHLRSQSSLLQSGVDFARRIFNDILAFFFGPLGFSVFSPHVTFSLQKQEPRVKGSQGGSKAPKGGKPHKGRSKPHKGGSKPHKGGSKLDWVLWTIWMLAMGFHFSV